jgi:presenilin-like A22 family membrane protease
MVKNTAFLIVGIFLITQLIGLYAGNAYLQSIKTGEADPVIEDPENIENSFNFFIYILMATVLIFAAVRFWKPSLKGFEAFAIFFSSWITFDFLIPVRIWYLSLSFFLALILTTWKMLRPTLLSQNVAAIFSGAGVATLLGASFGIVPSLIFLMILCIYDFVSVFVTKHMVSLAKIITEKPTVFTIAAPHRFEKAKRIHIKGRKKRKFHVFQLGLGDIVMPLMFSISLLNKYTLVNSIFSILGSTIALALVIYYMLKKPQVLPALPFITLGTLSGFLFSLGF